MVTALANGAATIWPHASIEAARQASKEITESLLCGERGGKIIEGFDCGNSPREFTAEKVHGRTLVHCTTNGTKALESCRGADRVLIGAFVNCQAVVEELKRSEKAIVLCAGTDGEVTGEDVLFAGAIARGLCAGSGEITLNDQAQIALGFWDSLPAKTGDGKTLRDILAGCRGGRPLVKLGYDGDIDFCAQLSIFDLVPELDQGSWRIGQA